VQTNSKNLFILVLGIVFIVRCLFIFYVVHHQVYAWDDSYQYLQIAKNLPHFSQMSEPPYVPDLQRMPLYPIFLWLCGLNPVIVLFAQLFFQSATAFFMYKILHSHTKFAFHVVFVYWIMPNGILFSSLILTECAFVFFMTSGLYYIQQKKWISANILITLSVFIRPNSVLMLFFLLCIGLLYLWRNKASKQVVISFFTGISISFLCVFGWMYRNYTISHQWKLSVLSDNTLIHGRLGGFLCYQKKIPYTDDNLVCQSEAYLITQGVKPLKTYYSDMHRQETELYTQEAHKKARQYIFDNFSAYILFQADCAFQLYKGMGYKSWLNITENKPLSVGMAVLQVLFTCTCMILLFRAVILIKHLEYMQIIVLLSVLTMIVLALLPYADTRYRFPTDSLIFLLLVMGKKKY